MNYELYWMGKPCKLMGKKELLIVLKEISAMLFSKDNPGVSLKFNTEKGIMEIVRRA